jgi:hypothetical protein
MFLLIFYFDTQLLLKINAVLKLSQILIPPELRPALEASGGQAGKSFK